MLLLQNLCSAVCGVLKCTKRYSPSLDVERRENFDDMARSTRSASVHARA